MKSLDRKRRNTEVKFHGKKLKQRAGARVGKRKKKPLGESKRRTRDSTICKAGLDPCYFKIPTVVKVLSPECIHINLKMRVMSILLGSMWRCNADAPDPPSSIERPHRA